MPRQLAAISPLATTFLSAALLASTTTSASAQSPTITPAQRADAESALTSPGIERYREHLYTLSSPFFEGRLPGTRGGELAADYIQFWLEQFRLQPAYPTTDIASDGSEVRTPFTSFRQPFPIQGTYELKTAELSVDGLPFELEKDFNPIPFSGNATAKGPIAFVGYSITMADDGYSSYAAIPNDQGIAEPVDLTGKIAVVLRYEPMNDDGSSKYAVQGWSYLAGLAPKIGAAVRRGAAGVILVSPQTADDPRAGNLESLDTLGFGAVFDDVPVVMATPAAADTILRAADPKGRSFLDFVALANETGGVIDLPAAQVTITTDIQEVPTFTDNVGAIIPGAGDLKDEYIVIGGHYDHLGYGKFGSREPNSNLIHPGADDNASGTAGVLLLAERMAAAYQTLEGTPRRSILVMLFGAEESGLNGSRYYVENPIVPIAQHEAMLNFDMIGRLRDELDVGGFGSAEGFLPEIQPFLDSWGVPVDPGMAGSGPSDHASFYAADIPVLFFHTGLHTHYHTPSDTVEKINEEGAVAIIDLAGPILLHLATDRDDLRFTRAEPTAGLRMNRMGQVKVRFGIMPADYDDDKPGVLIGDTFEGTSAHNAGLRAGDRMIRWNKQELTDVESWMPILTTHEPGDEVVIVYIRDDQEYTTTATLQGRSGRR